MIWLYRILATGIAGVGLILTFDEPTPQPFFLLAIVSGISAAVASFLGLFLMVLPGSANVVNSLVGRRFALIRWGMVVINAAFFLSWVGISVDEGFELPLVLITVGFLALLLLSALLASSWGKASKEGRRSEVQ